MGRTGHGHESLMSPELRAWIHRWVYNENDEQLEGHKNQEPPGPPVPVPRPPMPKPTTPGVDALPMPALQNRVVVKHQVGWDAKTNRIQWETEGELHLPDGCEIPLDKYCLPQTPNSRQTESVCTCVDDTRTQVAAYLWRWPEDIAVPVFQFTPEDAEAIRDRYLDDWGLKEDRLFLLHKGLAPGVWEDVDWAIERLRAEIENPGARDWDKRPGDVSGGPDGDVSHCRDGKKSKTARGFKAVWKKLQKFAKGWQCAM